MTRTLSQYLLLPVLLLVLMLVGCKTLPNDPSILHTLHWKQSAWQQFSQNLELPLSQRMLPLPESLLQDVINNDLSIGIASAHSYSTRSPTFAEASELQAYLALLPESYITLMQDKLLAIFLVENFAGAGLSDWVVDDKGKAHYYMILNPDLFRNSLTL